MKKYKDGGRKPSKEKNLGMICCDEAGQEIYCALLAQNGVEIVV